MRSGIVLLLLAASATVFGQTASAPDKWIGSWSMNTAKSKYATGILPISRTLSFEPTAGGMKAMSDLRDEVGSVHIEFTAKYDGEYVPMRGPFQGNTIAVKRIDAFSFETVQKNNGAVAVTTRFVISRDGRTLTGTASGVAPDGTKYTNVTVYDRVPTK